MDRAVYTATQADFIETASLMGAADLFDSTTRFMIQTAEAMGWTHYRTERCAEAVARIVAADPRMMGLIRAKFEALVAENPDLRPHLERCEAALASAAPQGAPA